MQRRNFRSGKEQPIPSNFILIYNERLKTLFVRLEGSIDREGAKELVKRVRGALDVKIQKVILDFKDVRAFSSGGDRLALQKGPSPNRRRKPSAGDQHTGQNPLSRWSRPGHLLQATKRRHPYLENLRAAFCLLLLRLPLFSFLFHEGFS